MAAPVKAYIDPTSLWRGPVNQIPAAIPQALQAPLVAPVAHMLHVPVAALQLPILLSFGPVKIRQAFQSKIPTPPMGRISILTFPSIYKEQGGGVTGPTTGQIYPPFAP